MKKNWNMALRSLLVIGACCLFFGCQPGVRPIPAGSGSSAVRGDQTFLGSCRSLRASDGFRQNVWLCFAGEGHGAVCMDLDRQLYLVVRTGLPVRPVDLLSDRFRRLQVAESDLRGRMHPEAFVLDQPGDGGSDAIFRIPTDAGESFAADLFNELLGLDLKSRDLWFQWD